MSLDRKLHLKLSSIFGDTLFKLNMKRFLFGKPYSKNLINHFDIISGGKLVFYMISKHL